MATTDRVKQAFESCNWPTAESVGEHLRDARRAVNEVRHAAEEVSEEAAHNIRRHPLTAVGAAAAVGVIAGLVIGFGAARFARRRA